MPAFQPLQLADAIAYQIVDDFGMNYSFLKVSSAMCPTSYIMCSLCRENPFRLLDKAKEPAPALRTQPRHGLAPLLHGPPLLSAKQLSTACRTFGVSETAGKTESSPNEKHSLRSPS